MAKSYQQTRGKSGYIKRKGNSGNDICFWFNGGVLSKKKKHNGVLRFPKMIHTPYCKKKKKPGSFRKPHALASKDPNICDFLKNQRHLIGIFNNMDTL